MVDGGVHHVGFHEDDGAVVEAVGEQVARPQVGVAVDRQGVERTGRIDEWRQAGDGREGVGDGGSDEGFLLVGAAQQFF